MRLPGHAPESPADSTAGRLPLKHAAVASVFPWGRPPPQYSCGPGDYTRPGRVAGAVLKFGGVASILLLAKRGVGRGGRRGTEPTLESPGRNLQVRSPA